MPQYCDFVSETDYNEKGQEEPPAGRMPFLPRLKAGGLLACFYESMEKDRLSQCAAFWTSDWLSTQRRRMR